MKEPMENWTARAACKGMDTDDFYPEEVGGLGIVRAAQMVCWGCPVRAECLDEAMRMEQGYFRFGVWGGLSVTQRRQLHDGDRSALEAPTFPCGHVRSMQNTKVLDRRVCRWCSSGAAA